MAALRKYKRERDTEEIVSCPPFKTQKHTCFFPKAFDMVVLSPVTGSTYGLLAIGSVTAAEPTVAFKGLTWLNRIVQGNGDFNRVGSYIRITSIHWGIQWEIGGSAPVSVGYRWLLIYDRQPNGAFPAIGDIFALQGTAGGASINLYGLPNLQNKERFLILHDKYETINYAQERTTQHCGAVECDLTCFYKGTAGTITDIATGAIYFVAFSDVSGASPEFIIFPSNLDMFRIYYTDY